MRAASVFELAGRAKVRNKASIDPDHLVIEHNVKPPTKRLRCEGKYDAKFANLKPGSAIRCEADEVNAISVALQKQVKGGKWPALLGCQVTHVTRCEDGHARVFVFKK